MNSNDLPRPKIYLVFRRIDGSLTCDRLSAEAPPMSGRARQPLIEACVRAHSEEEAIYLVKERVRLGDAETPDRGIVPKREALPQFATGDIEELRDATRKIHGWPYPISPCPSVLVSCGNLNRIFLTHDKSQARRLWDFINEQGCGSDECRTEHEIRNLTPDEAQLLGNALDGTKLFPWLKEV